MRSVLILSMIVSVLVAGAVGFIFSNFSNRSSKIFEPEPTPVPTPLAKYEIETLATKSIRKGQITIKETLTDGDEFDSYLFEHSFDPTLESGDDKIVTGQLNIPDSPGSYPIILMIRGYVDQTIYETGIGTRNAGAYFAKNRFITLAPDFLGYAGSSTEAGNIFETRFQTYTTVLSLLSSLGSIKDWDGKNIFIWAHSNGGQVALTTLAITKKDIPTTLWAPVTKPFPYSVLYYTDESLDEGKLIRRELGGFENLYDVYKYSFSNYLKDISAPLLLHQGGTDDAIPVSWSEDFVADMRNLDKDIEYFYYPAADHNLRPNWDEVIARDLEFFSSHLKD